MINQFRLGQMQKYMCVFKGYRIDKVIIMMLLVIISNSYTMGCPPVLGDNPRALASGLSQLFYATYISVDLAHYEIFCAKVGKGGIIIKIML